MSLPQLCCHVDQTLITLHSVANATVQVWQTTDMMNQAPVAVMLELNMISFNDVPIPPSPVNNNVRHAILNDDVQACLLSPAAIINL